MLLVLMATNVRYTELRFEAAAVYLLVLRIRVRGFLSGARIACVGLSFGKVL